MKKIKIIFTLIFVLFLSLLNSCRDDDEVNEIYLEGEPIPGIEIAFPAGYYNGEPLMPKISPDGKKLLFTGPAGLAEWKGLWIMDLDTQQKTLLHPNGRNGDWAPDSEWIVFNSGPQIFKMKIDGTGLTQLTFQGRNFFPDWAPNGEHLVVNGSQFATIIDTNGNVIQFLEGAGGMPDWKNDGNAIIGFKGYSSTSIWTKLTVFDLSLNKVAQILGAAIEEDNRHPRSSPDNSKITFQNIKGIWVMDQDGEELKRIIPNHLHNNAYQGTIKLHCGTPSWHPDGQHIIYEHFKITKSGTTSYGILVEGVISFYKVNVEDAATVSNLKSFQ